LVEYKPIGSLTIKIKRLRLNYLAMFGGLVQPILAAHPII